MTPELLLNGRVELYGGDSLDVLDGIASNSIDACVTDPPYHLASIVKRFGGKDAAEAKDYTGDAEHPNATGAFARASRGFMGKTWDGGDVAFQPDTWRKVLRVLKPGAHLVAFSASKNFGHLQVAIEAAGFEVRDCIIDLIDLDPVIAQFVASLNDAQRCAFLRCIDDATFGGLLAWVFGSGFPKSLNVAKQIDKTDVIGPRRERALRFTAWMRSTGITAKQINTATETFMGSHYLTDGEQPEIATADMFDKLRPSLPAVPPEIEQLVASRTVESENLKRRPVIGEHSKEAQAARWRGDYDGSKVQPAGKITKAFSPAAKKWEGWGTALKPAFEPIVLARKPLAGTVAENVLAWGTGALNIDACRIGHDGKWPANLVLDGSESVLSGFPAEGAESPASFFYNAKADNGDRLGSHHPTVKPLDLMQWLVRMVTRPGQTVLDLFAGTGTTGEAAWREGRRAVLIEREPEYQAEIRRRMRFALGGPEERKREAIKQKQAREGKPVDLGPLFGGGA